MEINLKIQCAHTELLDVDTIIEHPKNYNKHSARQIEMLAKIINFQGQRSPIVISKRSGFVVAGHGRLMAIKKLGWKSAACDFQDFENEAAEHAHMVADNKIAELAETDNLMLQEIAVNLGDDFDHEQLGLVEPLIISGQDAILDDADAKGKPQEFKVEVLCVNGEEMTTLVNELSDRGMIAKAIFNG
jgi:ParB-like chromosome segregation protein Spo0J